jgi:hypothetical protein
VILAIGSAKPLWLVLGAPLALGFLLMARFAPLGYRLAADGVHVERRAGPVVIAYRDIHSVDRAPRPLVGLSVLGSNGVFGRFGQFWNLKLGFYRLFVTDGGKVVWLQRARDWVALSPDRPDEFVARLSGKIAR